MRLTEIKVTAGYCFGPTPLVLANLAKVNFIHAPNGSGKTTISNALGRQPRPLEARSSWSVGPTQTSIRVFNEAYRSEVLNEHVNGIFTIGSASNDINARITLLEEERRERRAKREQWLRDIGSDDGDAGPSGLLGDIQSERDRASVAIFDSHKKISEDIRGTVFKGFRGSREKFFTEADSRYDPKYPLAKEVTWHTLGIRNASLTGELHRRPLVSPLSTQQLFSEKQIEQLQADQKSIGAGALATLIHDVGNGDWVSQGRRYLESSDGKCPFCQQGLPEEFESKLGAYFAAGYDEALALVAGITTQAERRSQTLETELIKLESCIEIDTAIEAERFRKVIEAIRTATELVESKMSDKRRHPTTGVVIDDIEPLTAQLNELISEANTEIKRHNDLVDHSAVELRNLMNDGWALFLTSAGPSSQLKRYRGIVARKREKIEELRSSVEASLEADQASQTEIETLRHSIANTASVAERINALLVALGFHRFHLATADAVAGGYRIVRYDGSLAFDTLSEGEKSFLCFAYFIESLTGSAVSGGAVEPVIAVIDDPISSLDSDTLFIVAAYIRDIAKQVIDGSTNIDQLIVLTHNTQFHHEAAYEADRGKAGDRHHYRLRKGLDGTTSVQDDGEKSKIRGSYELLWQSVVDIAGGDDESPVAQVGVFNIVRRIIEGYFKTVGPTPARNDRPALSVTDERLMSMFITWANSGSHTIIDDFAQSHYIGGAREFLQLLQLFFEQQGHHAHFDMMIRACGGNQLLESGSVFDRLASEARTTPSFSPSSVPRSGE